MFLSQDDLIRLTGWKIARKQMRWLADKGIPYSQNARGQVIVRADYDRDRRPQDEFVPGSVA